MAHLVTQRVHAAPKPCVPVGHQLARGGQPPHRSELEHCLVVVDEVALNVIAEAVLKEILPSTRVDAGVTILQPQVVGLAELEVLDEWAGTRIIDVLRSKMMEPGAEVESLAAYMQFKHYPLAHSAIQNELLVRLVDLMGVQLAT